MKSLSSWKTLSTWQKGYGGSHQRLRRSYANLVAAGKCRCPKCGLLIEPGSPWDLGHRPDRQGYLGPEHRRCNRRTNVSFRPRVSVLL